MISFLFFLAITFCYPWSCCSAMHCLKNITTPSAKRIKREYQVMDNIDYKEDQRHSMFKELPELKEKVGMLGDSLTETERHSQLTLARQRLIGQHMVSMLNSNGGILCFGVHKNGIILGVKLTRSEENLLKCTIDEAMEGISPCVRCDQYSVKFTPVKSQFFMDDSQHKRQVLEITVAAGDPYELYEDQNHEAFYRDGTSIVGPLTPHQRNEITIEKLSKKHGLCKEVADYFSPLHPSHWLCKALAEINDLHGIGHMLLARRAIHQRRKKRYQKSCKSSTGRSSLVTHVNGAIKKAMVSQEVIMCSKNSIDYLADGAECEKIQSRKVLFDKATISKDDVLETWSSYDLVEEIIGESSTVEVRSSTVPVVSCTSYIEFHATTVSCKIQKGDKDNVSSSFLTELFQRRCQPTR